MEEYPDVEFEYALRGLKRNVRDLKMHPRDDVIRRAVYSSLQEAWIRHCELCSLSRRGFSETGRQLETMAGQILTVVPKRGGTSPLVSAIRRRAKEIQRDIKEAVAKADSPSEVQEKELPSIRIGKMVRSQLQYMSPGAVQMMTVVSDDVRDQLSGLVRTLRRWVRRASLPKQGEIEIAAQLQSIQGQMKSSQPKLVFLEVCLSEIRAVFQSAPVSTARDELLDRVDAALKLLQQGG